MISSITITYGTSRLDKKSIRIDSNESDNCRQCNTSLLDQMKDLQLGLAERIEELEDIISSSKTFKGSFGRGL